MKSRRQGRFSAGDVNMSNLITDVLGISMQERRKWKHYSFSESLPLGTALAFMMVVFALSLPQAKSLKEL
jgi:hypothetical protein